MLDALQSENLAAVPGIAHGFFTRQGGVSEGLYGSLNCGLGSADDRERVLENRRRVAAHLSASATTVLTCHQIHSATAILVDAPWTADAQPKADALVTRTPGLVIGALAADCTPVLLADAEAGVIAAAHAGWKGALGGVLEATLDVMERAGAQRARIRAAVGPCISQPAYEVGPEFEADFLAADRSYTRYFSKPVPEARAHFNLPAFVTDRLRTAGAGCVQSISSCTYADPNRFFSYRRTTHARETDYGRLISALVLV